MPLEFIVPESIVAISLSAPIYYPPTDTYEISLSGHLTHQDANVYVLDNAIFIPRNLTTIVTLTDPGIGLEAFKKILEEQRQEQERTNRGNRR